MAILLNRLFASVAVGHLLVDILNGQRGILLAYLSRPLGLSNTVVGMVSTIYMLAQSLIQPVTGYLTDRVGPRWLVAGGVLWMGGFFALAVTIPGQAALIFLILASLGSGAFHPAGSTQATLLGRTHLAGREATTASYFFVFGQLGFFLGPLAGGPLLDLWGPSGLLLLAVICIPVGVFSGFHLRGAVRAEDTRPDLPAEGLAARFRPRMGIRSLIMLVVVAGIQSWIAQNINTFIPKYLNDMGKSASTYGVVAALFMAGSAAGNILGGYLSDRFSRQHVIMISLGLASVPLYFISRVGYSPWLYLLVAAAGVCSGSAYTSIFVTSQGLIPGGMGMATGLILAFMFSSGSVGALFSGYLADAQGFLPVFYSTAALALVGALAALGLKVERPAPNPVAKLDPGFSDPAA